MQTTGVKIFLLFLMLGYSQTIFAHVALDYPQGGETFIQEQTVTIQWHIVAAHVTLNWDLFFSTDGGDNWEPIELNIHPDSLSYTWHVPVIVTSQGRVRVIQDNTDQDYLDISMDFNIVPNTSPPTLDVPAGNLILECGTGNPEAALQSWLDHHGGAQATNHCDPLIWTNDFFQLSNDCGNTGDALVRFTATDGCGSVFTVASISILDTHPPVFDVYPENSIVECDGHGNVSDLNAWLMNHGGAHASDACSNIAWTDDYSALQPQCGASGSTIVSFIVTDACGNSASATASFIISDHLAPEITTNPQDLIMECGASNEQMINQWLENHADAQANDLCGSVHWTNDYSILNNTCGAAGNALITFTATDDCGNSVSSTAMLTIEDHLAPIMTQSAQDQTITCGNFNPEGLIQGWIEMHGGAQASDLCGSILWINDYVGLNDSCGISGSASVIFTASDACGNTATTRARISVIDTIPPVIDQEARDTTIACGLPDQDMIIQQWLDHHGGAIANDACGGVDWLNDFPVVSASCDTTKSYLVIFTIVDECLNSNSTVATFTIMGGTSSNDLYRDDLGINVYPNPVHDFLTLDLGDRVYGSNHLALFDVMGKRLWHSSNAEYVISIPVGQYASGVYILRFEIGEMIYSRIVVRQ